MIELKEIKKTYRTKDVTTEALKNVTLSLNDGEMVAVVGSSGSGKTTLLNIIGCIDNMDSGEMFFDGVCINKLKRRDIHSFRRKNVSFIFQNFELMKNYTVFENVEMPLIARGVSKKKRAELVKNALEKLEIGELSKKYPTQLSGG